MILTKRERLRRLRLRHRRAKEAIKLEHSRYQDEKKFAPKFWAFVDQLDREIREGK